MKNKNKLIVAIVGIIVLVILLIVAVMSINSNKNTLKCTKTTDFVDGINQEETLKIKLNKNKVSMIEIDKKINLSIYYQQQGFKSTVDSIESHLKDAYQYLDSKNYKITRNTDSLVVNVKTKKNGVILNNLEISRIKPTSRDDLRINSSNNLESSSSTIKINDEYKKKDLNKKLEGLGYTCKK